MTGGGGCTGSRVRSLHRSGREQRMLIDHPQRSTDVSY